MPHLGIVFLATFCNFHSGHTFGVII